MIHPRIGSPANIVFVEARKGGGVELKVEPPLIIYAAGKEYAEEARGLIFGVG
jgi:tRNA1(Val) A37 N6-methylase TrmN6